MDLVSERIVVLGCNSFGGSSVVRQLVDDGFRVVGINRSPLLPGQPSAHRDVMHKNNFDFRLYDLNKHSFELMNFLRDYKPHYVIDFAGQGMVAPSWDHPEQWYTTNVANKAKLHKCLCDIGCLIRYIRISTPEVYGDASGQLYETSAVNPTTPYAISHAAADMNALIYGKQFGLPVSIGRFANFYGAGQQLYRIIPRSLLAAKGIGRLILDGGGLSERSFLHGEDIADAVKSLMFGKSGEIYHFATSEMISIRNLVEKISYITGVDFADFVDIGPERPGKDKVYHLNCDKAKTELGWKPRVSLDQGLAGVALWIEENFTILRSQELNYIHRV